MNIIFYFSGTGNSIYVAKYISNVLGNTKVELIKNIKEYNLNNYKRVGFIFPVYYTHAPRFVVQLLKDINVRKVEQVFFVATFSGSHGYALRDVYSAFIEKNKEIVIQEFKINMPGNYILEYGAFPRWHQNLILNKAKKNLEKIVFCIKKKVYTKPIKPNLLAKIYKRKGVEKPKEFTSLGKEFYTDKDCILCGLCGKVCPVNNIEIDEIVRWKNNCEQCMACIQWCPKNSIRHPLMKESRKRYTNPYVSIGDMINE